jgi:hypothetical protein
LPIRFKTIFAVSRQHALRRAIRKDGNALHNLLYKAAIEAENLRTICITLNSRKVYVGWVEKSPNLRSNDAYVSLIPVMSGYRDKDSLDLEFTVSYPVDKYWDQSSGIQKEDFTVLLPLSQIVDARFFDLAVYDSVFSEAESSSALNQLSLPMVSPAA